VRVVLSDLDDTLFDHQHAARAAVGALPAIAPELSRWSLDELDARHRELLDRLHIQVLTGQMTIDDARIERFSRLVRDAGGTCSAERAAVVARCYRQTYERVWQVVPGALALVAAIRDAGLQLVIVTNNVVTEQRLKLDRCGLSEYVDVLLTSEEAGFLKPDARIFHLALSRVGAAAADAVMLGDAWTTDIDGARAAGIRPVWLNRQGLPSPDRAVTEIHSLEPAAAVLRVLSSPI